MTFLKRGIVYFLVGVGFGGLLYLFFLWQNNVTTQTTHQITSVVLVSGLIGIVSMIFEVDVIPITWEILIHFCLVYGLNTWLNMLILTYYCQDSGLFLLSDAQKKVFEIKQKVELDS